MRVPENAALFYSDVAQQEEQRTVNARVVCSNHTIGATADHRVLTPAGHKMASQKP